MTQVSSHTTESRYSREIVQQPSERQLLGLDALSKLTNQFSRQPDFEKLIEVLLMTLSGQFTVASTFALLPQPASGKPRPSFFATGKYRTNQELSRLELSPREFDIFLEHPVVSKTSELELPLELIEFYRVLQRSETRLLCALVHNDTCFGLIGLSERVTREEYCDNDSELLTTILNSVTPFIANSYLFWHVASLSNWYLDILNNVTQGVFVFDNDGCLKTLNTTAFEILRTFRPYINEPESLHGKSIESIFPERIFPNWTERLLQARANSQSRSIENLVARTADDERIYNVHISNSSEDQDTGRDMIVSLDDVTVQRASEQRLFDLQKYADKGLMASSISHELNNFLALILGGAEMAKMAIKHDDGEKASAHLDKLMVNVAKLERYTSGLMDYTKLSISKRLTNLNDVIEDILSFVAVQKKFKSISVVPQLDHNPVQFEMDVDQIAQLLLNLLNNAVDAIKEADIADGRITVTTNFDQNAAALSITDNGCGMKDEVKERLFRFHLTTKDKGHGYGLVTCAKIIENHAAKVSIESELGQGSTFTVCFPLSAETD